MVSFVARWLCLGLLVGVVGTISGCSVEAGLDDGGSPTGGQETPGGDGGFALCGDRTVSSLPGPGFVEMESSFQLDAMPPDSPLAKVIFGGISCQQQFDAGDVAILYEVGQQGEVLSLVTLTGSGDQQFFFRTDPPFNQRFVVTDGCLTLESDIPDQDMLPDFDPTKIPEGPCRPGQLPIGHNGVAFSTQEGPYICVRVEFGTTCHDCWVEDGAWREESVFSGSYVALGSIDNVSVRAWATACDQPDQRVSIAEGDRVDFTWTMQATYRTSPSPEELGYEAFEIPTWP